MENDIESSIMMYPVCFVYKGKKEWLIWQTDLVKDYSDSLKLDTDGNLISASSITRLKGRLGIEADKVQWNESSTMDWDKFWTALRNLRVSRASSETTCKTLLEGWNLIEDILNTFGCEKEQKILRTRTLNKAYQKLFYGNNLPSVTPEGRSYSPLWLRKEIASIRKAFRSVWTFLENKGYIN